MVTTQEIKALLDKAEALLRRALVLDTYRECAAWIHERKAMDVRLECINNNFKTEAKKEDAK